jgi:hypothetical protein
LPVKAPIPEKQSPPLLQSQPQLRYHEGERQLFGIAYQDAKRILEVYDAEVNCMYPMFHEGELVQKYDELWAGYNVNGSIPDDGKMVPIVKLALANGAVITNSCLASGKQLFEEATGQIMPQVLMGETSLPALICLLLIHQYQFHKDMGSVPYRTVGFASVIALELGLHKYDDLESQTNLTQLEREYHRLIFWCLYCMDRRLAVYTKKPCILREEDIDQKMPNYYVVTTNPYASENDLYRAMHLNYMIYYSQIAGKFLTGTHNIETIEKFETMLKNWQESLPPELKLDEKSQAPPHFSRKLKSILYLKSNLMLLHLYSSNKMASYPPQAVNAARQCIRELARLYFNTGLYISCEIQYNHFLVAALDVLYSATRAEPQKYSDICSDDLNLALRLVNLILKRPHSDQHGSIWRLVSSFAQKLGLNNHGNGAKQESALPTVKSDNRPENDDDFWQHLFRPGTPAVLENQATKTETDLEFSKDEILTIFNQLYEESTTNLPNEDTFNQDVQALRFFEPKEATDTHSPDQEALLSTLSEIFKNS